MRDDDTDERTEPDERTAPPRGGAERWRWTVPVAAGLGLVLVVSLVVLVRLLTTDPADAVPFADPSVDDAGRRQDVLAVATSFGNDVLSFDSVDIDGYRERVQDDLDGGADNPCWAQVSALVPAAVDPQAAAVARRYQGQYSGVVRDRGVSTIDPDSAEVIMAVDYVQSATVGGQTGPIYGGGLRLSVQLATDGDGWTVADCSIVLPPAASTEGTGTPGTGTPTPGTGTGTPGTGTPGTGTGTPGTGTPTPGTGTPTTPGTPGTGTPGTPGTGTPTASATPGTPSPGTGPGSPGTDGGTAGPGEGR